MSIYDDRDVVDQLPILSTHIEYEVLEATVVNDVRIVRALVVRGMTRPHRCIAQPCAERYLSVEPYRVD